MRGSRRSPSSRTSYGTRSSTTPVSPRRSRGGCSWTPPRRSCRRFHPGSGSTRPASSCAAESRSTRRPRSNRWTTARRGSPTGRASPRTRSSGRPASRRIPSWRGSAYRSTRRAASRSTRDCARVPNQAAEDPDPPTCQHALRQARRLAKNLNGDVRPYRYRMLGQVATLGRYKGIADVLGIRLRGFVGWFVTRTYHLYQLPLVTRKLHVVVDWTTALFFRRDIAELHMLGHPTPLGDD